MSLDDYIAGSLKEVKRELELSGKRLPTHCVTPMSSGYRPEMVISLELNGQMVTYYQEQVGMLQWAVELGWVDLLAPCTLLSTYLVQPSVGHLEQVLHIFA